MRKAQFVRAIRLFPKAGLKPALGTNQSWPISCAQTAIIPTNSVIDAKAAASSTKTRNITDSLCSRT